MSSVPDLRVCLDQGRYRLIKGAHETVEEANRYLEALRVRGLSPRTIRAYAYDLLVFYRWLEERGHDVSRLNQTTLLDFVAAQRDRGAHPHSINRRLVTCRQLYQFLMDVPLPTASGTSLPAPYYRGPGLDRTLGLHRIKKGNSRVLRVSTPHQVVEPLTVEQVRIFLRTLRRYRDLSIVYLMLLCGLRSREVMNLWVKDVSFEDRRIRVRGKGNKERMLPLPDILLASLSDYLQWERPSELPSPAMFVVLQGRRRGAPMTLAGLRTLFRWRRRNPVIDHANPHRFRHTFGADMARSGIDISILKDKSFE